MPTIKTISPIDNSVYVERQLATQHEIQHTVDMAKSSQKLWQSIPIADRTVICHRFVDAMMANKDQIAEELTWQIGRPISQTPYEVNGLEERARYMIDLAESALAEIKPSAKSGFNRYIKREPLGVVLVIAPWNYPYLTAVNSIIPAIMAGNTVILKPSSQTPLCAERFFQAFVEAGLPDHVFQFLHLSYADTENLVRSNEVNFVAFTGSVPAGHLIQRCAADTFIGVGLELGGKDPAYVRSDANLNHAIENITEGAFFNSGQSCCAIERIYVHNEIYNEFIEGFVESVSQYQLGKPLETDINLGPMVSASAAEFIRGQTQAAIQQGAKPLIDSTKFSANKEKTPYLAPQVLVDVDHTMKIMHQESFGPVVGIMSVESDQHAIQLMNDSEFGLTASVWTQDDVAAIDIGNQVDTGTWFMNRCDYLDPGLAWTGVKNTGRGCTLSVLGYEQLTRPKSFHLKKDI